MRHSISTREFYLMIGSLLALVVMLSVWLAMDTHNLEKVLLLPISLLLLAAYAKWFKQYKYVGNALVSLLIVAILGLMVIAELPSINLMNDQNEFKFFQLLSLVSALIFLPIC